MSKDLTNSFLDRKNILNNNTAIQELYQQIGFYGVFFEGEYRYTKQQISSFFEVDVRTIERLLENNEEELIENGYELFKGDRLRRLRNVFSKGFTGNNLINSKVPSIGIFTYKSFLNIGMLLINSQKARELRSNILDVVIDVLNEKNGGVTKYINQREEEFLPSAIREFNYREAFINALDYYIDENKFKYAQFTDKIYISIFKEKTKEYRQLLSLNIEDSVTTKMYSEVLDLVASYEDGFIKFLEMICQKKGRKLKLSEAHIIFRDFEEMTNKVYEPLREKARGLMASRDMAFRDALHEKLKDYVSAVSSEDFERFLGERSKSLQDRIEENKDVFQRLKDR